MSGVAGAVASARRVSGLLQLVLAAAAFVLVLAGLSLVAGWHDVTSQLRPHLSFWFALALVAEAATFGGYVLAYQGVARIRGGDPLPLGRAIRVVAIGFGAFLAKGGAEIDKHELKPGAADDDEGEARVLALDALEHAALAPAACAAAIALLVSGDHKPGLDFTIPWAVLVPLGAILAWWGVKHERRFRGRGGWRGALGQTLHAIDLLFEMVRRFPSYWTAFLGASIYWAGDVVCLWACLEPFGAAPSFAGIVIAHAAGYVLTRRTLPLAGAGIVELLMPLTLNAAGAPLSGAILGVLAYRVFNLWLPLLPAYIALHRHVEHTAADGDAQGALPG